MSIRIHSTLGHAWATRLGLGLRRPRPTTANLTLALSTIMIDCLVFVLVWLAVTLKRATLARNPGSIAVEPVRIGDVGDQSGE